MQNIWKLTTTLQVYYENVKFAASDVIRKTLCQRLLLFEYFELKITDNQCDDFPRMLSKMTYHFPKKILGSRISPTYKRLNWVSSGTLKAANLPDCRLSLFCCCWPTTLKQTTCRRPVFPITHNISAETENRFISAIIHRHCSVAASP